MNEKESLPNSSAAVTSRRIKIERIDIICGELGLKKINEVSTNMRHHIDSESIPNVMTKDE